MRYYKVKPRFDQKKRLDGFILIAGELYTEKEKDRFDIPVSMLEEITVSRAKTYWSFGARFAIEE